MRRAPGEPNPTVVLDRGCHWIATASNIGDIYLRSVMVGGCAFLGLCTVPILVKWLLIGRWTPRRIQIWSLTSVRLGIVKTLVRSNPMVLFAGSPLYSLYPEGAGREYRPGGS